ncbi:MAG: S41 family peptidase [Muribaculaceae bacterium]|nr:S41 family peptidase [Muribaculaceae bacterium]
MNKTLPILFLSVLSVLTSFAQTTPSPSHDISVSRNLTTFSSIVKELEMNYVDTIRPQEAFGAAIEAFLSTVDPYTEYYSSDDRNELTKITTGQYDYGGIGSYIMQRDGHSYISGPMEGAPAAKAGLRSGDWIIQVDTTDTSNMTSAEVSALLRGLAGTPVKVTVNRPFVTDSIINFDIVRAKLTDPSVPYWGVVNGNTGYIRLTQFLADSGGDVYEALQAFKANPDVTQIVLDLRGNGGGLLEQAVDILGNFLPKGTEVLRTRGRDKSLEKVYKTTKRPIYPDIPLAVLIDGASASASEITAGALQDLDRAVLVGSRSFGKGLVQSTRPLPFDGLLKVTVAKYYTPSGRLIQALDYSRRNADGSVARTPDSLTNVYHTLHGREVRDGGGLTPDINIEWDRVSPILYNLVGDNRIFDFATRYANTHDTIPGPWEFEVDEALFTEFKETLNKETLQYDKVMDQLLKQLREAAQMEGYLTEEAEQAMNTLTPLLTNDVNQDLDNKREEISEYLGAEIASRYYYENGRLIQSLKKDKALKEAIDILSNPKRLESILGKNP